MAKKKGSNIIALMLLILLVAGLAGFGVTNFGSSVQRVATVGSAEITATDYARAIESNMRNFERQTGQRLTFQQARTFGLDRNALSQLVSAAALEDEAASLGISAGDENVSKEIVDAPAFQGLSGAFDRQTYELALQQSGLSVAEFETRVRNDLSSNLLRRAVSAGVETPPVFVDTLFNFVRETRDVTWARLTSDILATPLPEPTDADLQAYYDANPDTFTRPETKVIRYAWLTPDMIVDSVEVDEAQVRALYDERIADYVQPERRLVERLVFTSESDAAGAKAKIDGGETTFDDLVAQRGLSLEDVDLGDVAKEDLGAAGDAVFGLAEPGVVGPFASDLGPALFRMNGILAAHEVPFEEAKDELTSEAASDRARRIISDSIPDIEDMLAGGADMALLAERTDMQEGRIEWNEEVFEGIAAYDGFRTVAAVAKPGDFPRVVELDDGGIFAMTVDEVQPPAVRPFEDVRDDVVAAWTAAETGKALAARADEIAAEIRGGREMAGLGLTLNTERGMTRDGFVEGTPPDFNTSIFGMSPDDVNVLTADGDAWIVRLDKVTAADPTTPEAQAVLQQVRAETSRELADALVAAYTQGLLDGVGIQLNQSAMNAVHASLP